MFEESKENPGRKQRKMVRAMIVTCPQKRYHLEC